MKPSLSRILVHDPRIGLDAGIKNDIVKLKKLNVSSSFWESQVV